MKYFDKQHASIHIKHIKDGEATTTLFIDKYYDKNGKVDTAIMPD